MNKTIITFLITILSLVIANAQNIINKSIKEVIVSANRAHNNNNISNIQIISGQGTANLVVKGISGVSPSLFGDISVTITDSKGYSRVLSTNKQVNMAIPVTGEINISGNYGGYLHEYNWVLDVTKVRLTTSGLSTTWYFWSGDWPVYFQNNPNRTAT